MYIGHTRGLDRGFRMRSCPGQFARGEEGSSRFQSSMVCTPTSGLRTKPGGPRTTWDGVFGSLRGGVALAYCPAALRASYWAQPNHGSHRLTTCWGEGPLRSSTDSSSRRHLAHGELRGRKRSSLDSSLPMEVLAVLVLDVNRHTSRL